MNFGNFILIYALALLLISPNDILGEKISNYLNGEIEGKFEKNIQKKLDDENNENYMIVKYKESVTYSEDKKGFAGYFFREGISKIMYGDSTIKADEPFTIEANNSIKIYFSEAVEKLDDFFDSVFDENCKNII